MVTKKKDRENVTPTETLSARPTKPHRSVLAASLTGKTDQKLQANLPQ